MNKLIKIAVTDDQVMFRECLVNNIKSFGNMEVMFEAGNGLELLKAMNECGDDKPDIVLMDLNMPEMNGMEATKQLKIAFPDVRVIVLSVHGEEKHVSRMIQQGVNGYIAKNSELSELKNAIETTYHNGFYFNEMVLKTLQSGKLLHKTSLRGFDASSSLTQREKEILGLICEELTTPEIADKLSISLRTVDGHRNNLLVKTGAKNVAGLVVFAFKHKIIDTDI
ncbi:response regulator transcription factor [Pedobacter sp. N36a]|uniref:response regulator transcription factor n=1 Tax=Pedobacter sp. N36a TaxID=2767996 RepID=UPI0016569ED4|nr:response regulator transcription factor [Pedobacter sp. N36a]MBC8987539.1 response regulator transcription factor [Pedobacter sp. N36a]